MQVKVGERLQFFLLAEVDIPALVLHIAVVLSGLYFYYRHEYLKIQDSSPCFIGPFYPSMKERLII